jgi:putative ABC transport system substrate-binding protein
VAVIATPGSVRAASEAKAATSIIPIVFGVGDDPVRSGLVANLARPGGNATGVNWFVTEVTGKRFQLLHQLVPKAKRMAVVINPNSIESRNIQDLVDAARVMGLSLDLLKASNSLDIDDAFASLARSGADAVYVFPDGYFTGRRVEFVTLAAHYRIPVAFSNREFAEAGGLMSYGASLVDMYRQVGAYTGQILKGAKPADLPVVQSTKFEFVLNLHTARLLGIDVPPGIFAIADEVIE